MIKIGIIVGSTRPGRVADQVAAWVKAQGDARQDAQFEVIDVADFDLPILDEPQLAAAGSYEHEHTKRWSAAISPFDGYIVVTPEYNHGVPGGLKNAFDFLYNEFVNKAIAFVSYGAESGVRSVESWRLISANFQMADVRAQVSVSRFQEFPDGTFTPGPRREKELSILFDQLVAWSGALRTVRHPE